MDGMACAEVMQILQYIPKEDYDKIPKELLNTMMQLADEESTFKYNAGVSFKEQDISDGAKALLAEIARRYW